MGQEDKLQSAPEKSFLEAVGSWLFYKFMGLEKRRFYGNTTMTWQKGRITSLKIEEHIIVPKGLASQPERHTVTTTEKVAQ